MNPLGNFYEKFYGTNFYRVFRRPHEFKDGRKFRIQFPLYNIKSLCYHVRRNSGSFPCMISTYGYISTVSDTGELSGDPEKPDKINSKLIVDRLFLDFDTSNNEFKTLIGELITLKSFELSYERTRQREIQKQLLKLIICDKTAEKAINEAKKFATIFQKDFGKYPALFFSGSKGAHAYCFFEPVELFNLNSTILNFAEKLKEVYSFETLDLSVNKDAKSRLSRIPYSKHQLTGLSVVPFSVNESYKEIIKKSVNPPVQRFDVNEHTTTLNNHLKRIDDILKHNKPTTKSRYNKKSVKHLKNGFIDFSIKDHRDLFKGILGEPIRQYPNKEYVLYHCPFPDHMDNNPSFAVYETNYHCFGCGKHGNYWQFLKDYNGWNNNQVRNYLKKQKEMI